MTKRRTTARSTKRRATKARTRRMARRALKKLSVSLVKLLRRTLPQLVPPLRSSHLDSSPPIRGWPSTSPGSHSPIRTSTSSPRPRPHRRSLEAEEEVTRRLRREASLICLHLPALPLLLPLPPPRHHPTAPPPAASPSPSPLLSPPPIPPLLPRQPLSLPPLCLPAPTSVKTAPSRTSSAPRSQATSSVSALERRRDTMPRRVSTKRGMRREASGR